MKYWKELVVVLLIALLLRLGPVALYGMQLSYDTPFHTRMASIIAESGVIPKLDTSLGSRPNNYPPFYHILLAGVSILSGLDIEQITAILLPVFSTLVVLSVFVLVRKINNERNAIVAALLVAIASPLIAAAYDSPENIVFFFLPIVIWLLYTKRNRAAALLYSTSILWNYFIAIITALPLLVVFWREKNFIKYLIIGVCLILIFQLSTKGFSVLENKSLGSGMIFIAYNLRNVMPGLVFATVIFFIPLMYIVFKERIRKEMRFFIYWNVLSFIAMLSFFFTYLLRGWEHIKFLTFSSIMIIGISKGKLMQKFVLFLAVFLLINSIVVSLQIMYPRINKPDLFAIDFLENDAEHSSGTILCGPSFSEHIRHNSGLDRRLLTSLYFENTRKESFLGESLLFMINESFLDENKFISESNMRYFITNFEDDVVRGTNQFAEADYFDKIYSLEYYQQCPFPFLPRVAGYACGWNKTQILKINENL